MAAQHTILVSFSGVDGAGKSTQIENLLSHLRDAGLRVRLLAFWDDVAVLKGLRETSSHALFNSEKGIGAPGKPVNRRDKNVRTWYMTPVRFFLYFLDAVWLRTVLSRALNADADVVVFDRYIYDELANLNLQSGFTRAFVRVLLWLSPKPEVAYLLDADPVAARERKPEYPLDFIQLSRASYLKLSRMANMNVMPAGSVEEVKMAVVAEITGKLPFVQPAPSQIDR